MICKPPYRLRQLTTAPCRISAKWEIKELLFARYFLKRQEQCGDFMDTTVVFQWLEIYEPMGSLLMTQHLK